MSNVIFKWRVGFTAWYLPDGMCGLIDLNMGKQASEF